MFSKMKDALRFYSLLEDEGTRSKIMEDNRKSAVTWSAILVVYWAFCLIYANFNAEYMTCLVVYITAFVANLVTLLCAAVLVKEPGHIRVLLIVMRAGFLSVALGISLCQMDVRTATIIALPLLTPVMFIEDTFISIVLALVMAAAYALAGATIMDPEVYRWALVNLAIYSSAGIFLSHFINKARIERYVFAESAVKLAQLQTRYAYYDQMTGLQNRRAYAEKVERLSQDAPPDCCVVMADINGLKGINDNLGHEAGDELITGSAECLRRSFEGTDQVYRLGGDEFCVILEGAKEDVDQSLRRLEEISASWKGDYIDGISISYGYACAKDFSDFDSVLKAADEKMYAFKENYYRSTGKSRRTQ